MKLTSIWAALVGSALVASLFVAPAPLAHASGGATVTAPSAPTFDLNAADQDPGNFVVSGFGVGSTVVSVSVGFVDPPAGVFFKLPVTTNLTPGFGYTLSANHTQVSFSGTVENVNAALAAMTVTTGSTAGNITIRVTASKTNKDNVYYNPINGHYYEYVTPGSYVYAYAPSNTGLSAVHLAEASELFGLKGYLATITSAQEQAFVFDNVNAQNIWLGGSDGFDALTERSGTTFANQVAAEGKWYWISGPDAGTQFWSGATGGDWVHKTTNTTLAVDSANVANARYENWCFGNAGSTPDQSIIDSNFGLKANNVSPRGSRGEPNGIGNSVGTGEQYLLEKWNGAPCWNDWGRTADGTQAGFLVEYSQDWGSASAAAGAWNQRRGSFATAGTDLFATNTVTALVDRAPKNVALTPGATSVSVAWAAPSSGTVTGYTVTSTPGSFTCTATPPATSCEVSGLTPETSYSFVVRATFSSGDPASSLAVSTTTTESSRCQSLVAFNQSDFVVLGNASVSGSEITLTPNAGNQKGGFWSKGRVDLASDFCVTAEVYLGSSDAGADGMAFVFQPQNSSELTSGGGLGYAGINPSLAVELDTFQNASDLASDHIALMKDGNTSDHSQWGAGSAYQPVALANIEDGNWRTLSVEWDASAKKISVHLNGTTPYSAVVVDLGTHFSTKNGVVYWGFTAATGGAVNLQKVRNVEYVGTERTNAAPTFVGAPSARTVLVGSENTIAVTLADDSTLQSQWSVQNPPAVSNGDIFASTPVFAITGNGSAELTVDADAVEVGSSTVTLTVTDADGATATHVITITVATVLPVAEPASVGPSSTPVVPPAVVTPPRVLPRVLPVPPPVVGPVIQNGGGGLLPPSQPTGLVGGRPLEIQTQVTDPNTMSLRAGVLNIGMNVPSNQGGGVSSQGGTTELQVRNGGSAGLTGSGLLPRSTVQVFMPLGGSNSREIARIPVDATGSFSGDAIFGATPSEAPLPIGRHVLQVVTVDENRQQTVVEMTVNIAQPPPAPEVIRSTNERPSLFSGQSIATNGGQPEPVVVTPIPDEKRATIEGDGWSMAVGVEGNGGGVSSGEGGAEVTFVRDQGAVVSGEGFMPGTRADVWLFSDPTLLGTVDIDANGEFNGVVNIDGNVVTVGEHTLQLQGVGADGLVRAANLGVNVMDEAPALTAESSGSLFWLWMLVLLGVVSVAAAGTWMVRRARGAVQDSPLRPKVIRY